MIKSSSSLDATIRKFVLANAYEHGGKAQPGAIVGKLIGADAISKAEIGKTIPAIRKIVADVGKLSLTAQEKELRKVFPEHFKPHEVVEKGLPELPELVMSKSTTSKSMMGKVVTRFEPSPSGPMHIGHAYTLASNLELARQYKGRCIIRVSDTNPENIYPGSYKMLKEDAKWLSNGFIKDRDYIIQSDRMKLYYKFAEKAINIGVAYVCTCDSAAWHKLMLAGQACPCRELAPAEHLARWKHMLKDWEEGKSVVRIKTDLKHKNPAMRDWPALRINTRRHCRQGKKYRVWPLMNFAVAIDDHEMGVTHAFRAKEHRDNAKRQKYLYDAFGWKMPYHWYLGAINFIGLKLSTTKTRLAIEAGQYEGWDDVRLPFISALKRRGYRAKTFIRYGIAAASENDKTVRAEEFFKLINKLNREEIDADADRYFFVADPVTIKLDKTVGVMSVKNHPDKKATRSIKVSNVIHIDKTDFNALKSNEKICIKDLFGVEINKRAKTGKIQARCDFSRWRIIQGVGESPCVVAVLMPNNTWIKGVGEPAIARIKKGQIVQFERFGFVRCAGKCKFIFGHR